MTANQLKPEMTREGQDDIAPVHVSCIHNGVLHTQRTLQHAPDDVQIRVENAQVRAVLGYLAEDFDCRFLASQIICLDDERIRHMVHIPPKKLECSLRYLNRRIRELRLVVNLEFATLLLYVLILEPRVPMTDGHPDGPEYCRDKGANVHVRLERRVDNQSTIALDDGGQMHQRRRDTDVSSMEADRRIRVSVVIAFVPVGMVMRTASAEKLD